VAIVSAACGALLACSKSNETTPAPKPIDLRMLPGGPAPVAQDPAQAGTPPNAPARDYFEYDGAPLTYMVTVAVEAGAPKVDPDVVVVQAAKASAAECFAGLTGGPDVRSAVIQVTVVPTGSVSRTEVSSDPDVADCLRRVGDGLHFSSKDEKRGAGGTDNGGAGIRSFSIDVSVTRNH
jgi:hypothetical protein